MAPSHHSTALIVCADHLKWLALKIANYNEESTFLPDMGLCRHSRSGVKCCPYCGMQLNVQEEYKEWCVNMQSTQTPYNYIAAGVRWGEGYWDPSLLKEVLQGEGNSLR